MNDNKEMSCRNTCDSSRGGGIATGIVVIAAGTLWLLSRMGMLNIPSIYVMWPSILVAVGFIKLFHRPWVFSRLFVALVLMSVGTVLQLSKLGYIAVDIHMIWPFLVILGGVLVIWTSGFHKRQTRSSLSENQIDKYIVFGGDETRYTTKHFEGGIVSAVFGGVIIDLREADIASSPVTLNVSAVFGGVEIKVPTNWRVTVHGAPVLGGYENKTRVRDGLSDDEIKTLIVSGNAVFGGVEIKN